jgi:hypothetical protein
MVRRLSFSRRLNALAEPFGELIFVEVTRSHSEHHTSCLLVVV